MSPKAMVYWRICKPTHLSAKLGSCIYLLLWRARGKAHTHTHTRTKVFCLPSFYQILDSRVTAHHYSYHCAVTTTKGIICVAESHLVCIHYQMFGDWEWQWWRLYNLLGNILPNIWCLKKKETPASAPRLKAINSGSWHKLSNPLTAWSWNKNASSPGNGRR